MLYVDGYGADWERDAEQALWQLVHGDRPMVGFDTETTGLGPLDEVISLGLCKDGEVREWKIRPVAASVKPGAEDIHGISQEQAMTHPHTIREAALEAIGWAGEDACFLAWNANFDVRLMRQSLGAAGEAALAEAERDMAGARQRTLCAMSIGTDVAGRMATPRHPRGKWLSLDEAAFLAGVDGREPGDVHRAGDDAALVPKVARGILEHCIHYYDLKKNGGQACADIAETFTDGARTLSDLGILIAMADDVDAPVPLAGREGWYEGRCLLLEEDAVQRGRALFQDKLGGLVAGELNVKPVAHLDGSLELRFYSPTGDIVALGNKCLEVARIHGPRTRDHIER